MSRGNTFTNSVTSESRCYITTSRYNDRNLGTKILCCLVNSRYKDILDIVTIWIGTERVVISRPTCNTLCLFTKSNNNNIQDRK